MKKIIYSLLIIIPAILIVKISPAQAVDCCCTDTKYLDGVPNIECISTGGVPCSGAFPNPTMYYRASTCEELSQILNAEIGTPETTPKTKESTLKKGWVETILGSPLIPVECSAGRQPIPIANKECGINSFLQLMVNVMKLMLGLLGSLALLMFVWGGFQLIFAGVLGAGQPEQVNKAKTTLTNAVIGLVIVLSAWVIINFVIIALTQGRVGLSDVGKIFNNPWTQVPEP